MRRQFLTKDISFNFVANYLSLNIASLLSYSGEAKAAGSYMIKRCREKPNIYFNLDNTIYNIDKNFINSRTCV